MNLETRQKIRRIENHIKRCDMRILYLKKCFPDVKEIKRLEELKKELKEQLKLIKEYLSV